MGKLNLTHIIPLSYLGYTLYIFLGILFFVEVLATYLVPTFSGALKGQVTLGDMLEV